VLVDSIRTFCQADATIKAAVGGTFNPLTPYTTWCRDTYTFPYCTMTETAKSPRHAFGSPYIEGIDIQFTFWDDMADPSGEARIRRNLDYFTQTLMNAPTLALASGSSNFAVRHVGDQHVRGFEAGDPQNTLRRPVWMGSVIFQFQQGRVTGTVST
jgi:hypothetical protein